MDLETKIKELDQGIRAVAVVFLLIVGYFGIRTAFQIPQFESIYSDMLAGKPLPPVTQFLISGTYIFILTSLVFPIVGVVAVFKVRTPRIALFTVAGCMVVTFIQSHIIFTGLMAPLFDIISNLSGAPNG